MKILPYHSDFFPGFVQLLDTNFGIKNPDKNQVIKRKFFDRPFSHHGVISCAIDETTDPKKLVGQYNNMPLEIVGMGKKIPGYICMDMCIDHAYRGQGLIKRLASNVYERIEYKTFTLGCSNSNGVEVDKKSGYTYVGQTCIYIIGSRGWNLSYTFKKERKPRGRNGGYSHPDGLRMIQKNSNYLDRRYFQKPYHLYDVFSLWDGEICTGYIVGTKTRWAFHILDIGMGPDSDRHTHIHTRKKITQSMRKPLITIQVLDNLRRRQHLGPFCFIKSEKKTHHHITCKIHDSLYANTRAEKNNRRIIGGDIM